jgi:hypothetical protein
MKFNSNPEWLKKQAALEDNSFVSVGGLVLAVEDLEKPSLPSPAQSVKALLSEEHAAFMEYVKVLRER